MTCFFLLSYAMFGSRSDRDLISVNHPTSYSVPSYVNYSSLAKLQNSNPVHCEDRWDSLSAFASIPYLSLAIPAITTVSEDIDISTLRSTVNSFHTAGLRVRLISAI